MIAFVSFSLLSGEDAVDRLKLNLTEWGQTVEINHWSVAETTDGPIYHKTVRDRISRSDVLIVILDGLAADAPNVANEITYAKATNVPFFGIHRDGKAGHALPAGLAADRVVEWQQKAVTGALTQLMREGKHHKFK